MIVIKVKDELELYCNSQLEKYNFGKRYTANGNKEQQLTGLIGQSIVMQLFGFGYIDGSTGFDEGIDLIYNNKSIDVKTMGRNTDVKFSYTNNFLKLQDYFKTEVYIFCSYNKLKKEITICGWIDKDNFKAKRKFYPKGTIRKRFDGTEFTTFADLYEIDNKDLNSSDCIEELKFQLNKL